MHKFGFKICVHTCFLFLVFLVFLTPPALPEVSVVWFWFYVWRAYTLSSLAFKSVTRGGAITNTFPLLLLPQVHEGLHEGATGHLEHTNN